MLERTLTPKFAIPFLIKSTLRLMPVIAGIPFWTITLMIGEPCRQEGPLPVGIPLSKEFRRGELDGRKSLPFPLSGSCFIPHLSSS